MSTIDRTGVGSSADLVINWAAEQTAFESWYLATQCMQNYRRMSKHIETGLYVDKVVRIAWRAWRQAINRSAAGKLASSNSVLPD